MAADCSPAKNDLDRAIDRRVREQIGNLVVQNTDLLVRVETLTAQCADLERQLAALRDDGA